MYSLAWNGSNSYGQNLTRHSAEATLTTPIVWGIFLTAHAELQRTIYEDPVLIDAVFLIDEDNRNALIASLARPLGDHWELELRYSLFLQEFGVGSDYDRQTFLTALAYLYD